MADPRSAPLLTNEALGRAVSNLRLRAERQLEVDRVVATYVDPGIEEQFENDNNQILFGRRGTGKTHVLKVLQGRASETKGQHAIYIDLQGVGSSSIVNDSSQAPAIRATTLLKDILRLLHDALLEYATRARPSDADAIDALDRFADVILAYVLSEATQSHE